MKLLFFTLLALLLAAPAMAQDLTLRNLMKIREMQVPQIDKRLSRKGWKLMSDSKPANGVMGRAVWAYQPDQTGSGAPAWCILYYNDTSPSRILYNTYHGNALARIHRKIQRSKKAPIAAGSHLERVEQLSQYADHADEQYVFRLLNYHQPGARGIKIFDKADYEKASANGRL
jgi:hypothetical protein